MSFLEKIFSVKNINDDGIVKRKLITIAGIRIKVKCKRGLHKIIHSQRDDFGKLHDDLSNKLEQQRQEIISLQEELKTFEERTKEIKECFTRGLSVYNLHQQVFPKYKNIHQDKEVVIVATGPSLKDYVPIENAIHIGVNRAFQFDKVKLDYYFLQDYGGFTPEYFQEAMNYRGNPVKKFFGIVLPPFRKHLVPESKAIETGAERYYLNQTWETEIPYDISVHEFSEYGSVVFSALLFALWTNPKRIYLAGCDCTFTGHFNRNDLQNFFGESVFRGWQKFKDYVQNYYPDTEMISINPAGLEGLFKDVYVEDGKYVDSLSVERLEKLFQSDDYATNFLKANKNERMDANRTDIFNPLRTAFHKDRYFFASQFVHGKTVVDVASGTGYGANLMETYAKPDKIHGLEINAKAVVYAKTRYESDQVEFRQGSITNMPFPDDFCEVLTSFETIEHVEDEHKQLQEIQRVLKPGGYYILSTPNKWGFTEHHVRDYDHDSVQEVVSEYFTIEAIFNQYSGEARGIIPTTLENHHLAECFIIVARNTKNNTVFDPDDKVVPVLDTWSDELHKHKEQYK